MVAKQVRAAYTQEFRLEAVRLVQSGQSQMQVCQTLGIPKASAKPDAAWEWLKWMTGMDGQRWIQAQNKGYTANIPALWAEHPSANDERVKFFFEILKTPQVQEFAGKFPYYNKVIRLSQDLYDRIYLGDVARDAIKGELDKLVPQAQEIVTTERAALGLG